jgi:Tol biopolymer transport system component
VADNAEDWSRDGRWIAYNHAENRNDIWTLSHDTRKAQPFLATPFGENHARFSPDGRWIAYQSNENGRSEVYIRPFPAAPGGKWQISTAGGTEPCWRADGRELFFLPADSQKLMAVDISEKNGAIVAGIPHPLFDVRLQTAALRNRYIATPDGKKFLVAQPIESKALPGLTVILNWPSLLRR